MLKIWQNKNIEPHQKFIGSLKETVLETSTNS